MKRIMNEILSYILTIVVSVIIVLGVREFIMEPFSVEGRSMDYTLADGERLFMFKKANIERFDVVVLPSPTHDTDANGNTKLYIKRVIGMPGDTIEYKDGVLHLNGKATNEPYLTQKESEVTGNFTEDFTLEQVAGSAVVPEGKVFLLGDNRRNSLDGRSFGFVDLSSIRGEADLIYWPLDKVGLLNKYKIDESGQIIQR